MRNWWYKNAIFYSLDVETFMDSDGDGIGDFQGLTSRLDYLSALGITCLWLLPFYPSPNRDNGYDVMDYYNIDPRLGTLGDFVEFMHQAGERGIRVMIDLVVNHTSNLHPWFQAARSDKNSKYHDYYVWVENPPQTQPEQINFPGEQESIWEYDEKAGAYYLHHFYKEQPDLNIANPEVQEAMLAGDRRRIELTYSLLFSLPGTPLLRYGEEIGMGDDLSLPGRDSVRTVMQWSDAHNGGFSTASPDALAQPVIKEGEYGYKRVNVATQQRDRDSLINWMERVIGIRKQCPQFGWGKWQILETDSECVFAHCCDWEGKAALAVHNLSDKPCIARLQVQDYKYLFDLFSDSQYEPLDGDGDLSSIPLEAYGYRWLQVNRKG
ncbi:MULTISPECIES: alpha-amylase family glycosyl hydrolase [Fischerella]|uniref:alpha-amylase family glycosyl hydrolase n=1 Tax=Fischerella TaxID=1190 RepID=UPI0002FD0224|nr:MULTISPECIES: alpha-amylase family glycosyl hydrolase [Fischerella]MBD2432713.1 hypothetical protein [Fischerella sp. FACHB-380]